MGNLSQRLTYPLDIKVETDSTLHPDKLFAAARARVDERPLKAGGKNAHALWGESAEQKAKGRRTPPFPLRPSSSSRVVADRELKIAFRFGAHQGEELRARDAIKHSLTNLD